MEQAHIKRLVDVFGIPQRPDPKAFFAEYAKAVGRWPDDVLHAGIDRLLAEHVDGFWPMPGKLRKFCEEALPPPKRAPEPDDDRPPLTQEQLDRMHALTAAFKEAMANMDHSDKPAVDWSRTQRPAFEEMMRNSPNKHLHLTERSRRMMGEPE